MPESPSTPTETDRDLLDNVASRFEPHEDPEYIGKEASAANKLFDLRLLIGGLFGVYGVLLTIYSFFDSQAEIDKSAGIHLNLWLGIAMIIVSAIFFVWARLQPQKPPSPEELEQLPPPVMH